ncbi:MAG: hypothetical protein EPN91_02265 [Salinibacterium sp.]|nr:MAG: hypothetical protein EPN91_02265 [Salinibacterium sp.]
MISHACAYTIASWWHNGQASEMYSFMSSGAISEDLLSEVEYTRDGGEQDDERQCVELSALAEYVEYVGVREPNTIKGWGSWMFTEKQVADEVDS